MLYIVSDIHSNIKRFEKLLSIAEQTYGCAPGYGDIVLVLGDLLSPSKFLKTRTGISEDNKFLRFLSKQPYQVISIRGNRENGKYLSFFRKKQVELYGGLATQINESVYLLDDGGFYQIPINEHETINVMAIGGAFPHNKSHKHINAKKVVGLHKKYMNLMLDISKCNQHVDLVISHEAPIEGLDVINKILYGTNEYNNILSLIAKKYNFTEWIFGHHHRDYDKYNFHCIYNRILLVRNKNAHFFYDL